MSDQIVPSVSIDALLLRRDAALDCLRRIRGTVGEYSAIADAIHLDGGGGKWTQAFDTRGYTTNLLSDDWLDRAVANVDSALWEHLMALSGVRSFMDAEAKRKWEEVISKNEAPPLTRENIEQTFRELYGKRQQFFEEGVIKIFRGLSWDYRSNKPQKFGTRIVIRYLYDRICTLPEHRTCDKLDDIVRAFCVLDKKPEPDHRQGMYQQLARIGREGGDYVSEYVRVRKFKNGNGHVYLLRQDLVEQMNLILHKHFPDALPAEAA